MSNIPTSPQGGPARTPPPLPLNRRTSQRASASAPEMVDTKKGERTQADASDTLTPADLAIPEWRGRCRLKPLNQKIASYFEAGLRDSGFLSMLSLTQAPDQSPQLQSALKNADWSGMRSLMKKDSAQYVALNALLLLADSKSGAGRVDQSFLPLGFVPHLEPGRAEADQVRLKTQKWEGRGDRAALALGSTYLWADGEPLRCQDGVYVSKHATVVTDGLGGHMERDAASVRDSQRAAGLLMASFIESAIATQLKPAQFLEQHAGELMQAADLISAATQCGRTSDAEFEKNGAPEGSTAFVAVANCPDGIVAFGAGDATAMLAFRKPGVAWQLAEFTPQPDAKSARGVDGIGRGEFELQAGKFKVERYKKISKGDEVLIAVGTDGAFPKAWKQDMWEVFGRHLTAESPPVDKVRDGMVAQLTKLAIAQRNEAIPLRDARDSSRRELQAAQQQLVEKRERNVQFDQQSAARSKDIASQFAQAVAGLDDVALVVRAMTQGSSR